MSGYVGGTPKAVPNTPHSWPHALRADSLKLSIVNVSVAVIVRVLDATRVYQGELLGVGVPLFFAPTLALIAAAFGLRDLRHGRPAAVVGAAVLTIIALWMSWWPILEAD